MKQLFEQTVSEIIRLCTDQPEGYSDEVVAMFADLTQVQALFVAAEVAVGIKDPDWLAVAIVGHDQFFAMESQAAKHLRTYDRDGLPELVKELAFVGTIAAIPIVAFAEKFRGIGRDLARQLELVSNGDQITEVV